MKNQLSNYFYIIVLLLFMSELNAANNPLLEQIPDKVLFFSGNSQLIHLDDYPLLSLEPSFDASLSEAEKKSLSAEQAFFYELYLDFKTNLNSNRHSGGNSILRDHYGLASEFAFAIYNIADSLVLKLNLSNERVLLQVLDRAAKKSGLTYKNEQLSGMPYRAYSLNKHYQFVVFIQKKTTDKIIATLAWSNKNIDVKQKKVLFGLVKPEKSVVLKVNDIQQKNQYMPQFIGFFDFRKLPNELFKSNTLWPSVDGDFEYFVNDLATKNCRQEFAQIAHDMPIITTGYKQYAITNKRLKMQLQVLLELENKSFKIELDKLRGFIPNYIHHGATDNIFSIALGMDFSRVMPMLLYINTVLRQKTFQCQTLKNIQKISSALNPMMLAMVMGLADDIKGLGFALHDFKLDKEKKNINVSALLSISAEEPLKLWSVFAGFSPENASVIPSDKAQKLHLEQFETDENNIFVVLKGQHLVFFSGSSTGSIVTGLSNEKLLANGFFQQSLNYNRLNYALKALRHLIVNEDKIILDLPAESCVMLDETMATLAPYSGYIDFISDFNQSGWFNILTAEVNLYPDVDPVFQVDYDLSGKYEIYYLKEGCRLEKKGVEEILPDGSGFYQQFSEDQQCFIFETRYRWYKENTQIKLQYVSERTRAEGLCSNAFNQWTIPDAQYINDSCALRASEEGDFSCVYDWDGVLNKALYKRQK